MSNWNLDELREALDTLMSAPKHPIRDVVCMFCTWVWITGRPVGSAAKCPRCGYEGGVEEFMVMKPGVVGFVVVRPRGVLR